MDYGCRNHSDAAILMGLNLLQERIERQARSCCLILPLLYLRIMDDATIAMQLHLRVKNLSPGGDPEIDFIRGSPCQTPQFMCYVDATNPFLWVVVVSEIRLRGNALSMLQISSSMLAVVPP
jgi:hypothetical protein